MFGLRGQELLIILLIVLLIFGARKLPDLARSIGASAKEFRKGVEEGSEPESDTQTPDPQTPDPHTPDPHTPDS